VGRRSVQVNKQNKIELDELDKDLGGDCYLFIFQQ
jgi:hypothetical protein